MDELLITLKVLKEILEKKQEALLGVLNISQNQETIMQSPPSPERAMFFARTTAEKQKHIDGILEYDEVFQRMFDTVKHELEYRKDECGEDIIQLQALISRVLELDIAIRAEELKNGNLFPAAPDSAKARTPAFRRQTLDALNKHKKHI
ncbi:MAG: hypothetical protein FWE91_02220 [Defluviitaleaceae bacterium]|nr:hypothetical protein [Defluviitaleaceae bacterium]MCL2835122.1 hypothetical protein [Defluviitaleaceae bacterium]